MANPALTDKRFKEVREEDPGWAAPAAAGTLDATATTTAATAAAGGVAAPLPVHP